MKSINLNVFNLPSLWYVSILLSFVYADRHNSFDVEKGQQ